MASPCWEPSSDRIGQTAMWQLCKRLVESGRLAAPLPATDDTAGVAGLYRRLHEWSISQPEQFWPLVWKIGGVSAETDAQGRQWHKVASGIVRMQPPSLPGGPRWFEGAQLNFAENLMRYCHGAGLADQPAFIQWNELGRVRHVSYQQLYEIVARMAAGLKRLGVQPGDRVAGFLPNIPETVMAMLATASIGAIWSSSSPDFGVNGVLDRFGQIGPKVLFTAPGYLYGGKRIDVLPKIDQIAAHLPGIEHVVFVPYLDKPADLSSVPGGMHLDELLGSDDSVPVLEFNRLPFDHPLYIMYSSGTTGLPKCMVHGAGGTLLQHIKELKLHSDVKPGDRVFYFTTCGWMMWNWLASSLACGAAVVLYDGNPLKPEADILWQMASQERITHFGTSAKYLALLDKEGVKPGQGRDLSALRAVLSTGSPLAPESYDYVYRDIKAGVQLASISGGTDIVSCFALGNPMLPVYRGELQSRGLGMAVEIWDEDGNAITSEPGELVCTRPFPSMPVSFWNDPDGVKYRSAYFEHYDGVWWHGDWAELTERGGLIIYGRSDATLNPGGVRIGTAEIYQQVETFDEVLESIVIGQDWEGDTRIVLFVRLSEGSELTDGLRTGIQQRIRSECSPHHVPRVIVAVPDIPRTISGKITELAVRRMVHGQEVKNRDALANPQALEHFKGIPELQT